MKKVLLMTAALSLAVFACKSSDENTRPTRKVGMSLEESRQIVQSLEAQQAKNSEKDPLRTPASMDDLLNILKRDQIDLFPAGVAYAAKSSDPKAKVLQAQIELAWGDAHLILAELFSDAANRLRASVRLASRGGFLQDAAQKQKIEDMKKTITQCETVGEALEALAAEHVSNGARISQEVINANPTDYQGWRLAADFYRMRGEWARFGEMVQKIEEKNPDSNGLVFLRGTAALERDGNVAESTNLLRQALAKDPQFTRAQAQLVLSRGSVDETYAELEKLRAMAPNHQIVVWAGPAITAAYNARQEALKQAASKSHLPETGVTAPTR